MTKEIAGCLGVAGVIVALVIGVTAPKAYTQRRGDMDLWAQTPHCAVYRKLYNLKPVLVTEAENGWQCGVAAQ